ncbi:MAG: hypothetical protein AAF907_11615 [Planctomycetota bacterium]
MSRFVPRAAALTALALLAATLSWANAGPQPPDVAESFGADLLPPPIEEDADALPPQAPITGYGPLTDKPSEVVGAVATETVLRCTYRPHPTRVRAIYEFLKAHAGPGVDVSVRSVLKETGERAAQVTYREEEQTFEVFDDDGRGRIATRTVRRPVAADGRPVVQELIVVAPPEQQRALGAFVKLCLADTPFTGMALREDERPFQPVPRRGFGGDYEEYDEVPYDHRRDGDQPPDDAFDTPDGFSRPNLIGPGGRHALPFEGFRDPGPSEFNRGPPVESEPSGRFDEFLPRDVPGVLGKQGEDQ